MSVAADDEWFVVDPEPESIPKSIPTPELDTTRKPVDMEPMLAPIDDVEVRELPSTVEQPLPSSSASSNSNSNMQDVPISSPMDRSPDDALQSSNPTGTSDTLALESELDPKELAALKQIHSVSNQKLPANLDCNPIDLINKLLKIAVQAKEREAKTHTELVKARREHEESNAKYKQIMDEVAAQAMMVRDKLTEQEKQRKEYEAARERQYQDQENSRKELEALKKHREQMIGVFKNIREYLLCPICTEVAILPKVLGPCGHIACQSCLKQLDDVAFSTLTTTAGGAPAKQHLLARRCPLCRVEIVGQPFPVLPLKDVASILIGHGYIEVAEQPVLKHIDAKAIPYEKENARILYIPSTNLSIGGGPQSELAQHSVNGVLAKVTPEQWVAGVYVLFEAAVSRVFFETFATTLHGKAGGVNVLVNALQRMLAVQLIDKTKKNENGKNDKKNGHILIKVAIDGRFVITNTPPQPPPNSTTPATITASVVPTGATNTASQPAPLLTSPAAVAAITVNTVATPATITVQQPATRPNQPS